MMRLFGTNGIREVVGGKMSAPFVTAVAGAIAREAPVGAPVLVGWDGRTSSEAFAAITSSTLALAGHRVLQLGVLPTPAVQYNIRPLGAQLAVMVTASHNPREFNGIKLIAADGLEAPRSLEEAVERNVAAGDGLAAPYDRQGSIHTDASGGSRYVHGILKAVDRARIAARKYSVVLDCGNGASVVTSPTLLRHLGCRVVTLNGHLDGTFPGHLSEPTESNLSDLIRSVPAMGADVGIAHDGDADRAVFVEPDGRFVPGEKILALLAGNMVRRRGGGVVVTPVTSSQAVEDAVRSAGGEVVYTRVGSPVVTHEMQARQAVFGGEENGGLIFPEFQLARDGAMTAAAVLDLLAESGRTLSELIKGLPEYHLVKRKHPCPDDQKAPLLEAFRQTIPSGARVVDLDGIKLYQNDGWVLLRASGTEPIVRIFAESRDAKSAETLASQTLSWVEHALGAGSP
jgi:phosphomannomutase / phosphoglucomutase